MQMYILGTLCVKSASVGQSVNLTLLFFGKVHSEFLLLTLKKFGDVTCFKLAAWLQLKIRFPLDPYLAQFYLISLSMMIYSYAIELFN